MKVRAGFVTNSSSTSFLIILRENLTKDKFLSMTGVDADSPLAAVFIQLFEIMQDNIRYTVDFSSNRNIELRDSFLDKCDIKANTVLYKKVESARRNGSKVSFGELSTDGSYIEGFFCCDSFVLEDEGIYINAQECDW